MKKTAVCVVLLAFFHVALFTEHLIRSDALIPVALTEAPPWQRLDRPPERVQDWGGTDKLSFTAPNLEYWKECVARDPWWLCWNPRILCGTPFLATQDTFALYPLNVVFLLGETVDMFLWSAILHGFLASLFSFFALRGAGVSHPAAIVGSLVYGGSGWWIAHLDIFNFNQAACWVPLCLFGADRSVRRPGALGVIAQAIGTGFGFLAGMAQITILGLFVAGCVAIARSIAIARHRGVGPAVRGLSTAALGVLLGLGLAAPQLLSTFEIMETSARSTMELEHLRAIAVRPLELTGALLPEFLGSPPGFDRWASQHGGFLPAGTTEQTFPPAIMAGLGRHWTSFIERVFYPGIIGFLLSVIGLLATRDARTVLAAALVIIGFGGAMASPILDVLYLLPGFSFGSGRRLLFLAVIGIAILASLGADWILRQGARRFPFAVTSVVVVLIGGLLVMCLVVPRLVSQGLAHDAASIDFRSAVPRWILVTSWPILAVAVSFLGILARGVRVGRPLGLGAIFLLMLVDLASFNSRVNPGQARPARRPESSALAWLVAAQHREPPFRFVRHHDPRLPGPHLAPIPSNLGMPLGLDDAQGYEGLVDRRIEDLFDAIEPEVCFAHHRIRPFKDRASLKSPLLDVMGVRYVLSTTPLDLPLAHADYPGRVGVFERTTALSRYRFAPIVRVFESPEEARAHLASPTFDARREIVLESLRDATALGLSTDASAVQHRFEGAASASIELLDRDPIKLRFAYATERATPLFIAESWHPSWTARIRTVDGKLRELPIVRADHAFRAVMIPPGSGELTLDFSRRTLWIGLTAAAASVLALFGLTFTALDRRRKHARELKRSAFDTSRGDLG